MFSEAGSEQALLEEEETGKTSSGDGGGEGLAAGGSSGSTAGAGGTALGCGPVPAAPASTCKVALRSRNIAVLHDRAAVKLRRASGAGSCRGTLRLTAKVKTSRSRTVTKTIGTASFSIATSRARTFTVKLNAIGRALLKAGHGRLRARIVIMRLSPRALATASVHLAQAKPARRRTRLARGAGAGPEHEPSPSRGGRRTED